MSRDRNSNDKPKKVRISKISNSGSSRPAASRARAPKSENSDEKKPAKTREPRLMSQAEAKSYEKTFDRPVSRKPAGKRIGKSFDNDAKFSKGDQKARPTKLFKNYERPLGENEKTRSFVQKRRFDKLAKETPKESIRLNKYIANSGICSRREADELITQGLVQVNGKVVTEMGYQVQKTDKVIFDGQGITPEKPVYVLLNKPKGYISTTKDEKARKTVLDLVANASPYRLFPVGRLDRSTTGVILLTNDGHMTK